MPHLLPLPSTFFPFLWHFLRQHRWAVVGTVLLALAAGFWGPMNSFLMKQHIDLLPAVAKGDSAVLFLPIGLIVTNFILLDNVTWRSIEWIACRVMPDLLSRIDNALLHHSLQHSAQFFQERMAGTLARQIGHVIDGANKILVSTMPNFLRALSLLLTTFAFAYHVHPVFFQILMVWGLFFFTASWWMSKRLTALSEVQAAKESVLGGQVTDSLAHASSVHLFARRDQEIRRRSEALAEYRAAYRSQEFYAMMMRVVQGGLIAIMMAFACYFLVHLHSQGLVTVGDFALILGMSMDTGHMMWYTMSEVDEFNKAIGRSKQGLDSLMVPIEIQDKAGAVPLVAHRGDIAWDKVTFHYKGVQPLFRELSIEIPAGQKVGLVGYSGGGKTTFVNLMLRLYDITDGAIRIDGQDIGGVTQDSLHEAIAMIPQDPSLFHRSLMENIRYGRLDATDEEVIEAAKQAHAHGFIELLPQGYDTLVGERGVKLSGGQRQRIAIARAILKNAPILMIDEATAQLDSVTEELIQASLWELMQQKTTLVIAHRLSTLRHMDRILVFDRGAIVEDGTHEELLAHRGLYQTLWASQVGGFLPDKKSEDEEVPL